jgi:hypothetical protein
MDREQFCKTSDFGLNSIGIQMPLFQKEHRKEKGEKTIFLEKGPRAPIRPSSRSRPGLGYPTPEPVPRFPAPGLSGHVNIFFLRPKSSCATLVCVQFLLFNLHQFLPFLARHRVL